MIVLDASVLIAYLNSADPHHEAAEQLLAAAVDDDLTINPLHLAEVLVGPLRDGRLAAARRVLSDLEVTESPFPAGSAVLLAELRADTGLRMPDCCVLLAAEHTGATFATFDARLAATAIRRGSGAGHVALPPSLSEA